MSTRKPTYNSNFPCSSVILHQSLFLKLTLCSIPVFESVVPLWGRENYILRYLHSKIWLVLKCFEREDPHLYFIEIPCPDPMGFSFLVLLLDTT